VGSVAEEAAQWRSQGRERLWSYEKGMFVSSVGFPAPTVLDFRATEMTMTIISYTNMKKTNDQNCANDHRRERSGVRNRSVELPAFAHKILLTAQSPCLSFVVIDVVAEQNSKQENGKGSSK
jgi:hypothetical protein